jgi:hypothetical protein
MQDFHLKHTQLNLESTLCKLEETQMMLSEANSLYEASELIITKLQKEISDLNEIQSMVMVNNIRSKSE